MTLICKNGYHLNAQRKDLEKRLVGLITIKKEQTSSHGIIEKSLHDMQVRLITTLMYFSQILSVT